MTGVRVSPLNDRRLSAADVLTNNEGETPSSLPGVFPVTAKDVQSQERIPGTPLVIAQDTIRSNLQKLQKHTFI